MRELLKNYTILYVEDEVSIQKNISEYLRGYFKEVYIAGDGKKGLEVYSLYKPDVLLLDINLPYMDGLSLAKEIRKQDKKVSIIMLTAFTDQDKLLQATELKLLKYLVKPVDLHDFQLTLDLLAEELSDIMQTCVSLSFEHRWNKENQTLLYRGIVVPLTIKEQQLLALFIKNKNKSITFEDIMVEVWTDEFEREISYNCVKNVVSNLRKKLPKNCIKSIYGTGYILQ